MAEEIDTMGRVGAVGSSEFNTAQDSTSGPSRPAPAAMAPKSAVNPSPRVAQSGSRRSAPQPSPQEIQAAVREINVHLATVNRVLELHVDAATGLTIATIRNAQTGAVLQQIPSTDSVHLAQMLAAWSPGKNVLVDLIA
ncbi:MAG TPA: flagellar protein FlaG [Steroidobacteraceae bacterium]|nr:flagellar protein FlaG [Steroidobacteraceae bacterium]